MYTRTFSHIYTYQPPPLLPAIQIPRLLKPPTSIQSVRYIGVDLERGHISVEASRDGLEMFNWVKSEVVSRYISRASV